MLSRIPLPKLIPDREPGGPISSSYNKIAQDALNRRKSELFNQYYGPNIKSEIAQREAATTGQNIFNRFAPEKLNIELEKMRREADKNKIVQNYLKRMLSDQSQPTGVSPTQSSIPQNAQQVPNAQPSTLVPTSNQNINQFAPQPAIPPGTEFRGLPSNIPQSQTQITQQPTSTQPINAFNQDNSPVDVSPVQQNTLNQLGIRKPLTYPQATYLSKELGLPVGSIQDVDGKKVAVTPFGNYELATGLSPGEKKRVEKIGEYSGEFYKENVEAFQGLGRQNLALDQMISEIDNPEFRNTVGPVQSFLTKYFSSSPERQNLLGILQGSSGEIALQVAPSLKGAFTGRDQTLINSIKANPSDRADIFIGKLKAQKLISTILQKRSELSAQYSKKMEPLEASKKSASETPLNKYQPQVDALMKGEQLVTIKNKKTGDLDYITQAQARERGYRIG